MAILLAASFVACVSLSSFQESPREPAPLSRPRLPAELEARIERAIDALEDDVRALEASQELIGLGPIAVPALVAAVEPYDGGMPNRRIALAVYCLGAIGEPAVAAVPQLFASTVRASLSLARGRSPENGFLWALARTAPFHSDADAIAQELEAGARIHRGLAHRAIAVAAIRLGPRPAGADIERCLEEVSADAVAALYAITQGRVVGFDGAASVELLFEAALGPAGDTPDELARICFAEAAVALSVCAPDAMSLRAWRTCLDHHDPVVQRRAASQVVRACGAETDRERTRVIGKLLAMHPDIAREPLLDTLEWRGAARWIPVFEGEMLAAAVERQPDLRFAVDAIQGHRGSGWTEDERKSISAAVRSPFFALWQPGAIEVLLARLCEGTDPDRGLLAAIVDALPMLDEARLRVCLAAVPTLVEREFDAVSVPPGPALVAYATEQLDRTHESLLCGCADELGLAWAAMQLVPGAAVPDCLRALRSSVPALRLRALEFLARADVEPGDRTTVVAALRSAFDGADPPSSFTIPGVSGRFAVDLDLFEALHCAAAEGLVRYGEDDDAVDALHHLLDSGTPEQRRRAATRLGEDLGQDRRRLVTLARHLDDSDPMVAIAAAGALAAMGPAAQDAIPDLEHEIEQAEDPAVRAALASALATLRAR